MKRVFPVDIDKYPCRNTSLKNLRNERWVSILCLEEYFHISNYGRIKSLAREIHYKTGKVIHKKERIIMADILLTQHYIKEDTPKSYYIHLAQNETLIAQRAGREKKGCLW